MFIKFINIKITGNAGVVNINYSSVADSSTPSTHFVPRTVMETPCHGVCTYFMKAVQK